MSLAPLTAKPDLGRKNEVINTKHKKFEFVDLKYVGVIDILNIQARIDITSDSFNFFLKKFWQNWRKN